MAKLTPEYIQNNLQQGGSTAARFGVAAFDDPAEQDNAVRSVYGTFLRGEKVSKEYKGNYIVKNPDYEPGSDAKEFILLDPVGFDAGELVDQAPMFAEMAGGTLGAMGGGTLGSFTPMLPGVGTVAGGVAGGAAGAELASVGMENLADYALGGGVMQPTDWGESFQNMKMDALLTGGISAIRPIARGLRTLSMRRDLGSDALKEGRAAVEAAERVGLEVPGLATATQSPMAFQIEKQLMEQGPKGAQRRISAMRQRVKAGEDKGLEGMFMRTKEMQPDVGYEGLRNMATDPNRMASTPDARMFADDWSELELGQKLLMFPGLDPKAKQGALAAYDDFAKLIRRNAASDEMIEKAKPKKLRGADIIRFLVSPRLMASKAIGSTFTDSARAQLMAEPEFVKWVVKAGNMPATGKRGMKSGAWEQHVSRLWQIADDNPETAPAIAMFAEGLMDAFVTKAQGIEALDEARLGELEDAFAIMDADDRHMIMTDTDPATMAAMQAVEAEMGRMP